MLTVRFQPAEQELGVGAQRRQWDLQLVDQCAALILLLSQLFTQLKAFQFSGETVADRSGTEAQPGIQFRGPVLSWVQINPQRSKNQISVLQGMQRRPRAGRRSSGSWSASKLPVIHGPLADQTRRGSIQADQIQPGGVA